VLFVRVALLVAVTTFVAAIHTLSAQDSTKALAKDSTKSLASDSTGNGRALASPLPAGDTGSGASHPVSAPPDSSPKITFGAFVDGYYAWDFNRPFNFDRAFTTQPARHAEFNINLAFVEAKLTGPRYRGRLALQYGTSVQANYAGEPTIGRISGPSVSQYIQEATVGYALSPTLWVDGGIFYAHTGYEGWVSRDNLAYTRSLVGDFSPYYEAGVKLTWQATPSLVAQLDVVNGWQIISNENTSPGAGVRVDYTVNPKVTVSYDNFVGNVAADSSLAQLRFYNDFILQYTPTAKWTFAAVFDVGTQSHTTDHGGTATWYGTSIIGKYHFTPRVAVVGRVERYADPDQAIIITGLSAPFKTNGASLGIDVAPVPALLWRTEIRGFFSSDRVWPTHDVGRFDRNDEVMVTSLALTI
jgi:Putative beta-barrel porin-2, OmpL-like. bbp2